MTTLLDVADVSKLFPAAGGPGPWARLKRRYSGGPANLPQVHAVDDVSFVIGKGETVGLVGESGCGKSTLVRALTRLIDVSDGTIKLGDRELARKTARVFARDRDRARIQMVFQDAGESVNPRFTAFHAIADPLRRLRKLRGKALDERVATVARQCGLPVELLSRFPHQLSGGQRARVGIARAIAVEPDLLVLDEPTAALDVSVQVVILQLLQRLKKEFGMSYLFVSHDLSVVRLLCGPHPRSIRQVHESKPLNDTHCCIHGLARSEPQAGERPVHLHPLPSLQHQAFGAVLAELTGLLFS